MLSYLLIGAITAAFRFLRSVISPGHEGYNKTRLFHTTRLPFLRTNGNRRFMEDLSNWIWNSLIGRVDGPLKFRLVLQPLVAIVLATRAGLKDAREGRPPYFWSLLTDAAHRWERLREGWRAVVRIFILAVVMDLVYQYLVLRWLYPVASLFVAFILAFLPYLLVRGPVNRIARRFSRSASTSGSNRKGL